MTLAQKLSNYIVGLTYESLPSKVIHEIKRRVIDSLACAYGAYHSRPGRVARELAKTVISEKSTIVLGTSYKTSPEMAAFANGTLIRFLDYNDTYLSKEPAHPSDNIAVALAIAEAEHLSGEDLIAAIVLAYEIQCRLCDAASLRTRGWDHVTYGAFSATGAASKLYKLDEEQTRNALAIAATTNNALRQTRSGEISDWKACAFANVAKNSVFAAELAKYGLTGPHKIFEGKFGFWNEVSGKFDLDVDSFGGVGKSFKIMDTDIKYHQAEYHAQSAIQAVLELRENEQIRDLVDEGKIDDIASIVITTFEAAKSIIADDPKKWHPTTRETADHSMPYLIAVALIDGNVGPEQFTDQRIRDPVLHELMEKISVVEDLTFTTLYPGTIPNEIEIMLKDGKTFKERVDTPKGHSRNPMTDSEVEEKFYTLTNDILPEEVAQKIVSSIWKLDELDVANLPFNHIIES